MKFKIDENISHEGEKLFIKAGYDVHTVFSEKLMGHPDSEIYKCCCIESRCLITLDLDFADITRFNSKKCGGIIVMRLPKNSSHSTLLKLISQLISALKKMDISHNLWIVEPHRIRIHQIDK